jgi:hypothetical protein
MHYRSPNNGKRMDRNSPPTAATPLTIQGRMPPSVTYLPTPEPGHPHFHELSASNPEANLPRRQGTQQVSVSMNHGHGGLGLESEGVRQHAAPDAVGSIAQVGGVPQHMAVQPPSPGDVLPVHPIPDQLARGNWSGEWYNAHGQLVCI